MKQGKGMELCIFEGWMGYVLHGLGKIEGFGTHAPCVADDSSVIYTWHNISLYWMCKFAAKWKVSQSEESSQIVHE